MSNEYLVEAMLLGTALRVAAEGGEKAERTSDRIKHLIADRWWGEVEQPVHPIQNEARQHLIRWATGRW